MTKPFTVHLLTRSNAVGGAARAAQRHIASFEKLYSSTVRFEGTARVAGFRDSARHRNFFDEILTRLIRIPLRLISGFGTRPPADYGLVRGNLGRILCLRDHDLFHLHWVGDGDLSLREIGRLPGPVVWTMHDMWTFLGAERFTLTDSYIDGYRTNHGEPRGRQFVNRVFFSLKKKFWKQPIALVAPSSWMAERAKLSPITSDWPIHVIPNALDTEFWTPGDSKQSRAWLGLPEDKWVILFGAVDPMGDYNKGADLLESALDRLRTHLSPDEAEKFHIAVFGTAKRKINTAGFPVTFLGQLSDDGMRDAYRSSNVVIVPSRLENLPQVATEAASCGVPVVAFNTCGLPDAVVHEKTGLLVEAFDTEEMAAAISMLFRDRKLASRMGREGRKRAVELWSYPVVAKQYLALYSSLIDS